MLNQLGQKYGPRGKKQVSKINSRFEPNLAVTSADYKVSNTDTHKKINDWQKDFIGILIWIFRIKFSNFF